MRIDPTNSIKNMKAILKQILSAIISIVVVATTSAQIPKEKTLFWKISGKGVEHPSYIFGTFHLLCADDSKLPDTVISIIHQSKQIYFEIKLDDPDMTKKIMQTIKMNDGHQLKDFILMKDYDSVSSIFQNKTQIPLQFVSNYKPYLLVSLLYPSMLGCSPVNFEKEIENITTNDSIHLYGLETVEFQMSIFDSIPYDEQSKMLVKTLLNFDDSKKELAQLIKTYRAKDITAMQASIGSDKDFGKYETLLLNKRNATWIPVISKAVQECATFFAVGAGHLGGSNGILNLLRKKGFIITPVNY